LNIYLCKIQIIKLNIKKKKKNINYSRVWPNN